MTSIRRLDDHHRPASPSQRDTGLGRLGIGHDHLPLRSVALTAEIEGERARTTVCLSFEGTRPFPLVLRCGLALPADAEVIGAWACHGGSAYTAGAPIASDEVDCALAQYANGRSGSTKVVVVRTHRELAEVRIDALSGVGKGRVKSSSIQVMVRIAHRLQRDQDGRLQYVFPTGLSSAARTARTPW
ncbi:MAG: hypothetical protein KDA22_14090, partial [Phycisphaerales bacterium]|nr:hypothetical protein [Phycisphaerales bacterium]